MRQKLENLSCFLVGIVTVSCALSWGLNIIDYGGFRNLDLYLSCGWRMWLEFGTGILAILALLIVAVGGFIKDVAPVVVDGVHDGP